MSEEQKPQDAEETTPVAPESTEETAAEAVEGTDAEATTETNTVVEEASSEEAEAAPVAEAAAEESPAEEATTDVVEDAPAEEPIAEEPVAAEEAPAPAAEAAPASTDDAPHIGFTGAILGDVITVDQLDAAEYDAERAAEIERLSAMIEDTLTNVSENDIVRGRVVSIGQKDVVIDIGFKSDGIVSRNEFGEELTAGDEVEVYLDRIEDHQGQLILSKTKADTVRRWNRIEDAFNSEEVLQGVITRRIKGGMIVELFDGMEAFLPGSQIDVRPVRDFDAYLEKTMEFKIVKLNPTNENIVVSHKVLIEKDLEAQRTRILSTMEPGQILEGAVKNITDFGVFIDLGGVDGLLHITDLSWGRVSHPSELVSLDDRLNVVVLDYDKERSRISLGLKQLQSHPWENIESKYNDEDSVEGKVVSITDYGAFVELEKGIEGLVHISEMSWTEHVKHPSQVVSLGQVVQVKILKIDRDAKKISLGMKQLEPDPWADIQERYPAGTVMRGRVRNITTFGVFVEIEPGIDGLVHISDLSWTRKIKHPSEVVKKGQQMDVVVLNIDSSERRISLGHKQVSTNPWVEFEEAYAEGTTTTGKVVDIDDKGIVVELPLEVEAFMPIAELKNGSTLRNSYAEGQILEGITVIRLDLQQKEITVSETAEDRMRERAERKAEEQKRRKEQAEERKAVETYTRQGSGPATLGELSDLAALRTQMADAEDAAAAEAAADAATAEDAPVADAPAADVAPEAGPEADEEEKDA